MNLPDAVASPTLKAPQVADLWGVSVDTLYETVRAGTCPVQPLRIGRTLRWPTRSVLRSLGEDSE